MKSRITGKDPDAGKDWRQEEKGTAEMDSISQVNGHEFEQTPWDGGGERSLACCSPWDGTESDTTEQLKNSNIFDNY